MPVDLSKFEGMAPGKWSAVPAPKRRCASDQRDWPWLVQYNDGTYEGDLAIVQTEQADANAAAIAAVPDLIAEVRELRAVRDEIERLRAALKTMRASHQRHMSNRELASIATVLGEEWNK